MNTELPPTIAAFFHAHNTGQTDNFNELFTDDALVNDQEQDSQRWYHAFDKILWLMGNSRTLSAD
jgi:hypothetical protein